MRFYYTNNPEVIFDIEDENLARRCASLDVECYNHDHPDKKIEAIFLDIEAKEELK